jgi:hypothetical protein
MPRAIVCPFCQEYIEDASGLDAGRLACPACAEEITLAQVAQQTPEHIASARAAREQRGPIPKSPAAANLQQAQAVMDVVGGVNLRWKDNVIQGIAIFVSMLIGAGVGPLFIDEVPLGVIVGAFAGLVAGLFLSGFVLMVFRMFRH